MRVTLDDVLKHLTRDEVNYTAAAMLGPDALPFLLDLVKGKDPNLASKAAYLASLIPDPRAKGVVEAAAASGDPVVRVSAAAALRNLPDADAATVLDLIHADADVGVRKVALKSATAFKSAKIAAAVRKMAANDPEPFVRELATTAVKEITK